MTTTIPSSGAYTECQFKKREMQNYNYNVYLKFRLHEERLTCSWGSKVHVHDKLCQRLVQGIALVREVRGVKPN